jgi:hypothetical protein
VGNLTTVSNSVRNFTTLLLGYYFGARLADDLGPGTELATFLKWEQLDAYARATTNKDFGFRNTERVKKNLSEGSRVTLSDERSLRSGEPKIYGIWGIFYATHDIMRTPAALENVIGHLKPGGRVLAAGLMWGKWWAVAANVRVFRMARRYVTTLEGLAKPWSRLEPLLSEIHVKRRIVRGLPAYVAVGRK